MRRSGKAAEEGPPSDFAGGVPAGGRPAAGEDAGEEVGEEAAEDAGGESPTRRSGWRSVPTAAASALGAALVLWRETEDGAGLTGRAVHLVSAARNYWDGAGFVGFATPEVPLGPPLYPLLLTLFSPAWIDPLEIAVWLNAALFGISVFVVGRYLDRRLDSGFLRVWAPFALAAALPLLEMSRFALPGPLFLLLSALAMIRTEEYLARGRPASLAGAAAFAALASWTQYLGIAALVGVVGTVLLLDRRATLPRRAFLGAAAAAALLPWAVSLPGSGGAAWYSRPEGPGGLLRLFAGWAEVNFLPSASGGWEVFTLAAMVAGALVVSAAARRKTGKKTGRKTGGPARSAARDGRSGGRAIPVFLGFAAIHTAVAALAFRFGAAREATEEGLLAPVYLALVVAAAFGFDRFFRAEPSRDLDLPAGEPPAAGIAGALDRFDALSGPARVVMAALTLWAAGQAVPSAREIERLAAEEADFRAGFTPRYPYESETLSFILHTPTPLRIYSNRPALAYLYTSGGRGFSPLPKRGGLAPTADGHVTPQVLSEWFEGAPEGAWVIWFRFAESNRGYGYGPPLLGMTPGLEPLVDVSDGVILRVNRSSEPGADRWRKIYGTIRSGAFGDPVVRSVFDLYGDGESLYYWKESCSPADVAAAFHLRLRRPPPEGAEGIPVSAPFEDRPFEDRPFRFSDYGAVVDGACVAVAPGSLHDFDEVHTGQGVPGAGRAWSAVISPEALKRRVYEPIYERMASGAAGEARARSEFDIYIDGNRILYHRESCSPADTEARFFLHFYAEASVLPEDRARYGFANRDFWFADEGWRFDGRCVARAALPEYPVSRIATGQYIVGGDGVWRAEIRVVE